MKAFFNPRLMPKFRLRQVGVANADFRKAKRSPKLFNVGGKLRVIVIGRHGI